MAPMNHPAPVGVTYGNMRFLIIHNPTNSTLHRFIEELKKYGKEGIQFLDWPFDDGSSPSNQIVDDWLSLVDVKFREEPGCCIAVHCVAGLGRTPVEKRRGAFNSKQLLYLEKYHSQMRLCFKDSSGHRNNCCIQ
uniref:Tyrosine specific protein phosphatases domain-containing protein n=1 Tax=Colobus angolensis palliatus TaxID=336983 RepID=A0A2K5HIZ8_COLAP